MSGEAKGYVLAEMGSDKRLPRESKKREQLCVRVHSRAG